MSIQYDNYLMKVGGAKERSYYQGTQHGVVKAMDAGVAKVVARLLADPTNPGLFSYCCTTLASCRSEIAKENNSQCKEAFGQSRANPFDTQDLYTTHLTQVTVYKRYGQQFSDRVRALKGNLEKGGTRLDSIKIPLDFIEPAMACRIFFSDNQLEKYQNDTYITEDTKKKYPKLYEQVMLATALRRIGANPMLWDYKLYTLRMKMKDPSDQEVKWFELSRFILELPKGSHNPPRVHLIHQDRFLIQVTMNKAQELFNQALQWDGLNVAELQKIVGTLFFCLSHAMPWKRGSAAIIEMFQAVIYRYHGFHAMQEPSDTSLNLEALTALSLEDFLKVYQDKMSLEAKRTTSARFSSGWLCVAVMAICLGFVFYSYVSFL